MSELNDFARLAGPMENEHVLQWKADGGRVIGYFCSHSPDELFWAAGFLPVRMRGTGSRETTHSDSYLGAVNCSFVRHTLNRMMKGDLSFLDGLLVTNSCDHIRRLSDITTMTGAVPFCHLLDLPHINSDVSRGRLAGSLRALRSRLRDELGAPVTDEALADAIRLHNRTRELLQRAAHLRGEDPPRLSGSELLAMSVSAASMPKDRFNQLLERRLEEIESQKAPSPAAGPRILVLGGMLDDPGYLQIVEEMGACIVADQLCCGAKTFECRVDEVGDPYAAIARRMLEDLPCPRMIADYDRRVDSIAAAVEEYRVDAILCERLKFCDLWGGEVKMLRDSVRERIGVPMLVLERDYLTAGGIGQMKTRVQAFLENL